MGKASRRSAEKRVQQEGLDEGTHPMVLRQKADPVINPVLLGPDEDGDFILKLELPGESMSVVIPAKLAKELCEKMSAPHVAKASPADVGAAVAAAEAETGLVLPGGVPIGG
jgi:hypothetical protein